jgi:glucose uptake protein
MQERSGDAEARAGSNSMILPASQSATLVLLVISLICWGSWANTLKLAGKWRFELYYYDFALGFAVLAVVAAFTAGSLNSGELTFQDNFLITGYRNMAYVVAAGVIFNLGNMLLAATIVVSGMALAFTITFATALVVATAWSFLFEASSGFLLSLCGAALLLGALVMGAAAYSNYLIARSEAARAEAAKKEASQPGARMKRANSSQSSGLILALALGVAGGIALGLFRPLLNVGSLVEGGVAPYGAALMFAAGILVSTAILDPFFFNFPVAGDPIGLADYFRGTGKQHALGFLGGVTAGIAFLAGLLALGAPSAIRTAAMPGYALSQGAPVLAAAWGLFVWREFKNAGERSTLLFRIMWVLLAIGVGLLAVAQR